MQTHKTSLFAFLTILFFNSVLGAVELVSSYPTTILRVQQHNYSGSINKSFSESLTGTSAGISLLKSYEYFVPYVGINIGGQSGRQSFLDGVTSLTSNYTYQYGGGEAGIFLFPLGRANSGLSLYINGAGIAGYQSITLKTSTALTTLTSKSDQSFSTGYKGNVGFEWILRNKGNRTKWTIYTEVGFKKESTNLLKQTFILDSFNYTLGLGW